MAKPPDLRTSEGTASSASADVPTRPPVMTRRAALAVGAGGLTAGLTTVGVGPGGGPRRQSGRTRSATRSGRD
jgi:hypothetical protein